MGPQGPGVAAGLVALLGVALVWSTLAAEIRLLRQQLAELKREKDGQADAAPDVSGSISRLDRRVEAVERAVKQIRAHPPAAAQGGGAPPRKDTAAAAVALAPPAVEPTGESDASRRIYGGKGDMAHLGGFTQNDTHGQSPALWGWMLKVMNVRSFLDVGCGRGISTKWMLDRGVDIHCVEGSRDAVAKSLLPSDRITLHDFSRGPWWPGSTYDVAWAVEFLEHVGRQHMAHYMSVFEKAAFLFVTHSNWGGWHHVEVHDSWWWRARFEARGFVYSEELTAIAKKRVQAGQAKGFHGGHHLAGTLQVFINPAVAKLPEHAHLLGGPGCCCLRGTSEPYVCGASGHDPSMNEHDWLAPKFLPVWTEPQPSDDKQMKSMNGKGPQWRRELGKFGEAGWGRERKAAWEKRKQQQRKSKKRRE